MTKSRYWLAGYFFCLLLTTQQAVAQGLTPGGGGGGGGGGGLPSGCSSPGTGYLSCTGGFAVGTSAPTATGAGILALEESTSQVCAASSVECLIADATTHKLLLSSNNGAFGVVNSGDGRDVHIIPFAASPAGTAASGITYATGWTPTNRVGSNNIGAALQAAPSTGATLYFELELPTDIDLTKQPYIRLQYGSGANTSGTVIWTVSSACSKSDGSVTDDPAYHAESAFATQTMAVANRSWAQTGQFTAITSGNNCIAGSPIIFKAVLSGTASSAINAYQAVLTIPIITNAGQAE